MENDEKMYFYYYKPTYDSLRINNDVRSNSKDRSSNYNVTPSCMKTRLCLFWMLWTALFLALVASILTYCCLLLPTCSNVIKDLQQNTTSLWYSIGVTHSDKTSPTKDSYKKERRRLRNTPSPSFSFFIFFKY